MYCRIEHESKGRLRIRMRQRYMLMEEADLLEGYLRRIPGIKEAKVNERTANVVITYGTRYLKSKGSASDKDIRDDIIRCLSEFDYDECRELAVREPSTFPLASARQTRHDYENKMAFMVVKRIFKRMFLPVSLRRIIVNIKAVPFICRGLKGIFKGRLDVEVLDAISISASLLLGDFATAGSVIFMLQIGDLMDEWTRRKSVQDLAAAMALNVDRVWVKTESGEEVLVGIDEVHTGDTVIIRTGNLIPLDGEVVSGDAMVNQSSITGEPLAVHKKEGGYIYAGSVVEDGELLVKVRSESGSGRYDRIISMIEDSEKLKSAAEERAFSMADRLVPWTLGATALTFALTRNVARATAILMVDFCCALKLSMPIAVLSAMREAGSNHISVKGGKFMEAFAKSNTIVLDKTGTLTEASPRVKQVVPFGDNDEIEMLRLAACLEEHYPHSLANAVVKEAKDRGIDHEERHSKVEYVVAHGIASSIDGEKVRIGSYHFLFEDEGVVLSDEDKQKLDEMPEEYSRLYLSLGERLAAVILIEDPLKNEAKDAILALKDMGFEKIVMMTGDGQKTARSIATQVGVDEYHFEVLPEDKANFIKEEHAAGRTVVMVGDGVNDSPALSEADVGVAMSSGAAISREIADVTISEDDLFALVRLRRLSELLMKRIDNNYRFILTFNAILMGLGGFGVLPSSSTALLHNASTLMIGLNSMTDLEK